MALKETERLKNEAKLANDSSFFAQDKTFISFLNARSLRKHQKDIQNDPELMKSSIIGIAETNLHENEEIHIDGFEGTFVNGGKGKGVAAFVKIPVINTVKIMRPTFSVIVLEFEKMIIGFAYMSKQANIDDIKNYITPLIQEKLKPMVIMGDMNYHFSHVKNQQMKSFFENFGFHQLIEKATHDEGHIIDHIYVSDLKILSKENVFLKSLYFSDHDALCVRL